MRSLRGFSALLLAAVTLAAARSSAPVAAFSITPNNPVAGQQVVFLDVSTGNPTSWSWDFGDGTALSTQQSPRHAYATAGQRQVGMTVSNAGGSSSVAHTLFVSPMTTLRLDPTAAATHPFDVTLAATDQRTGRTSVGQALPQSQGFGYFSLPSFTADPNNAEVFAKILDGTAINGQYWVFYGHLTDVIYDLTVTEVSTGASRTYHKAAGDAPGGFDTSAFGSSPAPTPTAPAATVVNLVASNFRWDFDGRGENVTLHVGQTYELHISRAPGSDHAFSGLQNGTTFAEAFGCGPANLVGPAVCRFTPISADVGNYFYFCTNALCGTGHSDPAMQNGVLTIAP